MNPRIFTFDGPPSLPVEKEVQPDKIASRAQALGYPTVKKASKLICIVETQPGVFELVARPVSEGKPYIKRSTGATGFFHECVVTSRIADLPRFGKVSITTQDVIAWEKDGELAFGDKWDPSDWQENC